MSIALRSNRASQSYIPSDSKGLVPQYLPECTFNIHSDMDLSPFDTYRLCYTGVSPSVRQRFIERPLVQHDRLQRAFDLVRHVASVQRKYTNLSARQRQVYVRHFANRDSWTSFSTVRCVGRPAMSCKSGEVWRGGSRLPRRWYLSPCARGVA
jgi:hypothetical protein